MSLLQPPFYHLTATTAFTPLHHSHVHSANKVPLKKMAIISTDPDKTEQSKGPLFVIKFQGR